MIKYLIDTDVAIDHIRGSTYLQPEIIEQGASISIISLAELFYGAYKSDNQNKSQDDIDDLLKLGLEIKNLSMEIISTYAQIKAELEKTGQRLDEFDLMIGATAKVNSLTLLTRNVKHFGRINGLKLKSL